MTFRNFESNMTLTLCNHKIFERKNIKTIPERVTTIHPFIFSISIMSKIIAIETKRELLDPDELTENERELYELGRAQTEGRTASFRRSRV